jgi:hypothetical protein
MLSQRDCQTEVMTMMFYPQTPQPPSLAMTADRILHDVEAYWQSLRQADLIPARVDVAAHQIDAALSHAFILQRVAPRVGRFRVAGQNLHDLLKMDPRGMPVSTLFSPASFDQLGDLVETAFVRPAIVSVGLVAPAQLFRAAITAQMLLLPLRDGKDQTSRILGAIVADGPVGNRPRRFDLAADAQVRIAPLCAYAPQQKGPRVSRAALRLVVNNG